MAPKKDKAPPPPSKPAKSIGGKQKKKKWSKGKQKEKLNNAVLFDQTSYDKMLSEVPKVKHVTPSVLSERLRLTEELTKVEDKLKVTESPLENKDRFIALVEERSSSEGTIVHENSLYYEVVGGTKKQVFGLESQASCYYDDASSSACRASMEHNAKEVNQQVQAVISSIKQRVDEMVDERMHQLKMKILASVREEIRAYVREEIRLSITKEIRASIAEEIRASVTEELRVDVDTQFQEMQRQFQEQMQHMLGSVPQPSDLSVHSSSDQP